MIFPLPFSSQSDPVVWSQLRFPQGFLKGKQTALNCSCAFFNCWLSDWSCQTICSISHGKQYKLIYGLAGWHNSPERLKAFLNLSTLWESLWASEAKDNCAHLSQSCWSERKESTIHLYCCLPFYQYLHHTTDHPPASLCSTADLESVVQFNNFIISMLLHLYCFYLIDIMYFPLI